MFSLDTPSISLRPLPPAPMAAMFSLSLGAGIPRPRTWRGTIIKPAPAAAAPSTLRRVMSCLGIAVCLFRIASRCRESAV